MSKKSKDAEKKLLTRALAHLFLINRLKDRTGFHVTIDTKIFSEEVLKPLQEAAEKHNSEIAREMLRLIHENNKSHIHFQEWLDSDSLKRSIFDFAKRIGIARKMEKLVRGAAETLRKTIAKESDPKRQWGSAKRLIKAAKHIGIGVAAGLVVMFARRKKKAGA